MTKTYIRGRGLELCSLRMGTYGADGANGATGYLPKVAGFVLGEAKARGGEEVFLTQGSEEQLGIAKLKKAQDSVLLAEGFEPAGGDLWRRDGIYFGREAALQEAHSSLLQRAVRAAYDEPGETPEGKAS